MLEAQFLDGVILDRVILEKSKDKKFTSVKNRKTIRG